MRDAISVASSEDTDARGALGCMNTAIADPRACRHVIQRENCSLPTERGLHFELGFGRSLGPGDVAVDGVAGAYEIAPGVAPLIGDGVCARCVNIARRVAAAAQR